MKYRKKPVEVEAFQTRERVVIKTLEGEMAANPGDWIVTGIKGETYPCRNDIFRATYEPVGMSWIKHDCLTHGIQDCRECDDFRCGDNQKGVARFPWTRSPHKS